MEAVQLRDARDWIADCFGDVDAEDLTERQVVDGIKRHYCGGVAQFITDGCYEVRS